MKIIKVGATKITGQIVKSTSESQKNHKGLKMASQRTAKPTNALMKRRAKKMRNNPTHAEERMCKRLDELNIKYLCQKVLGWYIADILLLEKLLIIELDGAHHYTESGASADFRRSKWLEGFGFSIIRVPNKDVDDFDLTVLDSFPTTKTNLAQKAVNAANKERNRALYYAPVQQDRWKNNRKKTKQKNISI